MGLFEFILGKKKAATDNSVRVQEVSTVKKLNKEEEQALLQPTEVLPGVMVPKAIADHWQEVEKTRLTYISITATPADDISVLQSSFGYYPRLPKGFPYPKDVDGNLMFPLAQINCSELPVLSGYPQFGYLQFYISTNDLFGADFTDPQAQNHFRVLYFEEDSKQEFETDFSFTGDILKSEFVPVFKPHRLEFSIKEEYIGIGDVRSENKELFDLSKITRQYPSIADELEEAVWDTFQPNGHKIGGYAYFTQSDPRIDSDDFKDYVLLLQIDSDNEIMWGDCGVANFFIHPGDLVKKDFSKVMYSWDCS